MAERVSWVTLLAPLFAVSLTAGCGGSPGKTASDSVAAACREYSHFNNTSDVDIDQDRAELQKIVRLAAGTPDGSKFDEDFKTWEKSTTDSPSVTFTLNEASKVGADCLEAGVNTGLQSADASTPDQSGSSGQPAVGSPAPSPGGPSCTQQMRHWLAEPDGSPVDGTIQHDISSILFAAASYKQYPTQSFLNDVYLDLEELTANGVPQIPVCADPAGTWQNFVGAANDTGNDTAGTGAATADVQSTLDDFDALKNTLTQTAPGSGITGAS